MKKLFWKLLLPLFLLSGLSLLVARLLNPFLDFSSIFLNLTTDFIMVIITIYYVNEVLKESENEKWKMADFSINRRISDDILHLMEQISRPFGVYGNSLIGEIAPKLYNQRGTPQSAVLLYFARKMSHQNSTDFEKQISLFSEVDKEEMIQGVEKCISKLHEILDLFGSRLKPELLLELVDTQEWLQLTSTQFGYVSGTQRLLEKLANIVEIAGVERLEYYMKIDR